MVWKNEILTLSAHVVLTLPLLHVKSNGVEISTFTQIIYSINTEEVVK